MTNIKAIGDNSGYWKKSTTTTKHLEPITILPEEETTIKQFVTDYFNNLYFLCPNGKIYESDHNNWKDKLKPVENIPVIKSIHSGYHHVFAMTDEEDPKIYGWGKNNYYQLGLPENKEYSKPTLLQYSKDINIHEIHPVGYASVFLDTERHILYGCGNNSSGQTSIDKNEGVIKTIQKSQDNVMRVFTGHAAHSYLIKSDGHLYAFGSNYGQFGNGKGTNSHGKKLEKITLWFSIDDINKMTIGYKHSAILTNDGKVYVCGLDRNTGFGSDIKTFQQYPQFKDNKKIIKDMGSGFEYIAYLTEDNEIWASGSYSDKTNTTVLRKIISLDENSFFNRIVACDRGAIFVYKTNNSYLSQDFGKLLESGDLSDCKIKNIPVHKILIETRLGKPFDEITQYFEENLTLKEIEDLLEWVYCDDMKNAKRTNEILGYFGIHEPQKTKLLKDDLKQLLFDEETSDFTIIVKDNDEEEEYEEELHVHKFILAARSGLFKNMFQNIKEKLPNVKDYSGKSLETIELLISFLYTDKFPITADTDQEFIKEEFEDIAEYYQLNPKIPIMKIFKECSQK